MQQTCPQASRFYLEAARKWRAGQIRGLPQAETSPRSPAEEEMSPRMHRKKRVKSRPQIIDPKGKHHEWWNYAECKIYYVIVQMCLPHL
jgi:hypothetical protein